MKTGTKLETLAQQILAQAKSKVDYAMDTRDLTMTPQAELSFKVKGDTRLVVPTERCLFQIGNRIGIPKAYVERMREKAPELLSQNVNHWFQQEPEVRMLRTYDNGNKVGRAFLSRRYRARDNEDLIQAVIPRMVEAGLEVRSAEVTERRLYIQAVTPKLQGEVKKGDVVQAGVVIGNSEVGAGSIFVDPLLFRLACLNGMVLPSAIRRHHVGRAWEAEGEEGEATELFTDETRKLDDKAFWAKINDVVTASLTEVQFKKNVAKMADATKVDTGRPNEAVEIIAKRYQFTEEERFSVLEHLSRGGDLSLWGLANAVTRTAEDASNYDRAIDLERIGGEVIELPRNTFN